MVMRRMQDWEASKSSRLRMGEERAARLRNIKVNAGTPFTAGRHWSNWPGESF